MAVAINACFSNKRSTISGMVIEADGFHKDPSKVDAPIPTTTVTQVKAFVGLVGYCSLFFSNITHVLAPVYALTKDGEQLQFNEQCRNVF